MSFPNFPRLLLVLALLASPAAAAADGAMWYCWLQSDPRAQVMVACIDALAERDGPSGPPVGVAPQGAYGRSLAEDQLWFIPLYGVPFDLRDVERLVRAVMCRKGESCQVNVQGW